MTLTSPSVAGVIRDTWTDPITALYNGVGTMYDSVVTVTSTPTTSLTDVLTTAVTFSVAGANAYALCSYGMDYGSTVTTSNNVLQLFLNVDGANLGTINTINVDDRLSRMTPHRVRPVAVAAGSHTIKLQSQKAQAGGAFSIFYVGLSVVVFDIA